MRKDIAVLTCLSLLAFMANCHGSSSSGGDNDNTSPAAQITAPSEGSTFTEGDVIQFSGSGNDTEDGTLSGASLVWTSDIDGQIGMGETFTSSTLRSGAHQITLTATDNAGALGMDTVAITIVLPGSGSLPDTGQTASFTDAFGEDSDYAINPPHYTKLDASGNALTDSDTSWAMVKDDMTGLIWEVKTVDGGIHDVRNHYIWVDAQSMFIAQLNSDNFGGYADWRLPTVKELSALAQEEVFKPLTSTAYFPHSGNFWTSITSSSYNGYAYIVSFGTFCVYTWDKSTLNPVRAVRGEQWMLRASLDAGFVENGDGTVTDTVAGLMWQQGDADRMDWETALVYCENLNLAGYDDWRLPNRIELQSILDYDEGHIYRASFPNVLDREYWSSTSCAETGDYAFVLEFYKNTYIFRGFGRMFPEEKLKNLYVRAVRGG